MDENEVLYTDEQLSMFMKKITPPIYEVFKKIWEKRKQGGIRKVEMFEGNARENRVINNAVCFLDATCFIEVLEKGRSKVYLPTVRGAQLARFIAHQKNRSNQWTEEDKENQEVIANGIESVGSH